MQSSIPNGKTPGSRHRWFRAGLQEPRVLTALRKGTPTRDTAATVLSRSQFAVLAALAVALAFEGLRWGWHDSLVTVVAVCIVFYFAFISFKILLNIASYPADRGVIGTLPEIDDDDLPTFTVLLPNVNEKRHVLLALIESMSRLQYPKDKLQVLLLVEHWDEETQKMLGVKPGAKREELIVLPSYANVVLSIPGAPGTKPSACDFGLHHATGEYTVIFDSEDSPDPQILRKAVRDFGQAAPEVACLQARLLFWNIRSVRRPWRTEWLAPIVTRMYFVEYVVHFEFVLRGMARLGLIPPLGGTSNIFVARGCCARSPSRPTRWSKTEFRATWPTRWSPPGIRGALPRTRTSPAGWDDSVIWWQ